MKKGYARFILLWIGALISTIGTGLTSFGLGVYVFNMTGRATDMALITLVGFFPTVLLMIPSGALADRFDRRLLMILGDGLSGLGILFIYLMMLFNRCELWCIYLGILVSSVFSSLTGPAFNATITDLLGKEEFAKASGMMSLASSARFLVAPILAGALLTVCDIKVLLIIDMSTLILTVIVTFIVKKGIKESTYEEREPMKEFIFGGFKEIGRKRGILLLTIVVSLINFFVSVIQVLAESFILGFANSTVLGIGETISALGMLVSSIIIGIIGIKKNHKNILATSLVIAGIGMIGFGLTQNMFIICPFGFLFFACIPFANSTLDFMVRSNVEKSVQGRVWGVIGLISQIGSVISFACIGLIADAISNQFGIGIAKASGYSITVAGLILSIISISIYFMKSVKQLEIDGLNAINQESKAE